MGQYYHPVILKQNRKTVIQWLYSHKYGNGLKLMEHSYIGNSFVGAVERILLGNPQRIAWAGDYAKVCSGRKTNLYSRCKDNLEIDSVPAQVVKQKYIVNHTKKQFVDKSKVPASTEGWSEGMKVHPLPLLTCEGNGQGGGDFFGEDKNNLIGSWARNVISIEARKPKEYKEIIFDLIEK